jgi:hypothetical protein
MNNNLNNDRNDRYQHRDKIRKTQDLSNDLGLAKLKIIQLEKEIERLKLLESENEKLKNKVNILIDKLKKVTQDNLVYQEQSSIYKEEIQQLSTSMKDNYNTSNFHLMAEYSHAHFLQQIYSKSKSFFDHLLFIFGFDLHQVYDNNRIKSCFSNIYANIFQFLDRNFI